MSLYIEALVPKAIWLCQGSALGLMGGLSLGLLGDQVVSFAKSKDGRMATICQLAGKIILYLGVFLAAGCYGALALGSGLALGFKVGALFGTKAAINGAVAGLVLSLWTHYQLGLEPFSGFMKPSVNYSWD